MLLTLSRTLKLILSAALMLCLFAGTSFAQSMFETIAKVDDRVVTRFEYEQRVLLMQAIGTPGDLEEQALDNLINERLQQGAAQRNEIYIENEALQVGIEEFAKRAEMTGDEFLAAISQKGVEGQTFRDFVDVGLAWRGVVSKRFAPFVQIGDSEIDRALALEGTLGSAQILFSEIFLPTNTPENEALSLELAPQIAALTSMDEFSNAARRFSAGESRANGGRVENWVPIENLPPQIRTVLMKMKPGEVTDPIELPNALALFQLRAVGETPAPSTPNMTVDYAALYLPGGRSEATLQRAANMRAEYDTCDDLYKVAQGQPESVLDREDLPVSRIPRDIALELARLDTFEVSTALTRSNGQTLVYLMLCGRNRDGAKQQTDEEAAAKRTEVQAQLFNERLQIMAEGYLSVLRAEAVIIRP